MSGTAQYIVLPKVKGAIRYANAHPNGTAKSPVNIGWNALSEVSRADVDSLQTMCAFIDETEGEKTKSAYRFLHHKADDDHAVVLAGVREAMSTLNGSSSAARISDSERAVVYEHLAKHYREFEQEPPVLKTIPTEIELSKMARQVIRSTARVIENNAADFRKGVTESLTISGFASVATVDRQGDQIDPLAFDIAQYMANPQILVNHKLWLDENGNGMSVGRATNVVPVYAVIGSTTLTLINMLSGDEFKTYPVERFPGLRSDCCGLWVEADITVPDVIEQLIDGRLAAFSWRGNGYMPPGTTTPVYIDLMEISVVTIPANQSALLQIGKSLMLESTNGASVVIDLEAVNALMNPVNVNNVAKTEDGNECDEVNSRALEKALERLATLLPKGTETEGGENVNIEELLKKLTETVEANSAASKASLDSVNETVKGMNDRLTAIEQANTAKSVEGAAPKTDVTEEPSVKQLTVEDISTAMKGLFGPVTEALSGMAQRLDALEKTPAQKSALGDDTAQSDAADETGDPELDELVKSISKAVESMTPEDRNRVSRQVLAADVIPDSVFRRK